MNRLEVTSGHESIVEDMVEDSIVHLTGMSRRFDKLFNRQHDQVARLAVNLAVPPMSEMASLDYDDFDAPVTEAQLFEKNVEDAAKRVGICTLVAMEKFGGFGPGYMYNNKLKVPFEKKRTSAMAWVESVWAPHYASAFVEATNLGLVGVETRDRE